MLATLQMAPRCRSRCATLTTLVDQSRPVSVKGGELSLQCWSDGAPETLLPTGDTPYGSVGPWEHGYRQYAYRVYTR